LKGLDIWGKVYKFPVRPPDRPLFNTIQLFIRLVTISIVQTRWPTHSPSSLDIEMRVPWVFFIKKLKLKNKLKGSAKVCKVFNSKYALKND
jgi:hypothetical protein